MQRCPLFLALLASAAVLASCHPRTPAELYGRPPVVRDAGVPGPGGADAGVAEPLDAGSDDAGVPQPPEGRLRVATYNVRRLFDTVCDSQACGGNEFEEVPNERQFAERADQIATAIRGLAAHAVLLQEIETQAAFDALAARLPEMTAGAFGEIGVPGSVDVGILARGEIDEVRKHRAHKVLTRPDGTQTCFSRELLEVHLQIEDAPVVLFAAHFRSKSNDDPGRRLAEAQAAAEIIAATSAERPEALVVFGGDLNDEPGSAPLEAIESSGGLVRVAGELPDDEAGTYWYSGPHAIDHLFIDTRASGAYVPGTARVAHGVGWGLGGSDHAALVADFLPPQ
ncbi:MAG: endonuclease/exonuclease/phosphatase family protein [Myxococcales bacterium]|jgi:endonuclease/exonuclease/phosphatase family metal-dependent hydrolase